MSSVNLWAIGNCQTSALIDRGGRMVWACVPRVDGDPLFSALLGGDDPADGFWSVEMEDAVEITQSYRRNTPVLITRQSNGDGNVIEVVDFCPCFTATPPYRPTAFARIIRVISGSPRIRMRLRPTSDWGKAVPGMIGEPAISAIPAKPWPCA
jgi:GH15 family glucan-1,4-alpha-glucosidase